MLPPLRFLPCGTIVATRPGDAPQECDTVATKANRGTVARRALMIDQTRNFAPGTTTDIQD